jgi:galactose oxidase
VLLMGGAHCGWYDTCNSTTGSTNTAEIINLNDTAPQWRYTLKPMQTGVRKLHNATLLANGKVLVTGGTRGLEGPNNAPSSASNIASQPEIWDPATESWSANATLGVYRGYHSIALLLPDGRVLSAGGDYAGTGPSGSGATNPFGTLRASFEIYSPPYLFNGTRPTISSVPTNGISYGYSFFIGTPNTTSIQRITMLALSSVTHGFNMGQRFVELTTFTRRADGSGLDVTAPSNSKLSPPGYYMLFILNGNGVPSVARIIKLHT